MLIVGQQAHLRIVSADCEQEGGCPEIPTPPQQCDWNRLNPECDYGSKQVYDVEQNSCTGEYRRFNYHTQEGVCGAEAPTPPAPPAPAAHSCPDDVTYCDAGTHTNIHKHGGYWDGSTCVYAFDNTGQSCGQTTTPPPPPPAAAAQSVVCNSASLSVNPGTVNVGGQVTFTVHGDTSTYVGNSSSGLSNCSGSLTTDGTSVTCTATGAGSWTHTWKHCEGNVNNCSDVCTVSANFGVNQTVTPPPPPVVVTPPPPAAPVITNTNNNTNTNTVTVTNTVGNVGVAPAPVQTQVAAVQQLPKTGLPLVAWTALAFIPAGFRMRRFSKVNGDLENHPSFIYDDRKFKQDIDS